MPAAVSGPGSASNRGEEPHLGAAVQPDRQQPELAWLQLTRASPPHPHPPHARLPSAPHLSPRPLRAQAAPTAALPALRNPAPPRSDGEGPHHTASPQEPRGEAAGGDRTADHRSQARPNPPQSYPRLPPRI